jgi:GDP-4-dehydro-6-deoxy-D-mannose reductase
LFWERFGLPVVEARPFNHIGPRQALGFVVPDFASQIAAIKQGRSPATIAVGNLAAKRDFTDVRDVVRAYILLAEVGRPGKPYLICSGKPVSIQSILDELIAFSGLDIAIRPDPQRMRPADIPLLYGSHARLLADTGWKPSFSLAQSLQDVYHEWLDLEAETH